MFKTLYKQLYNFLKILSIMLPVDVTYFYITIPIGFEVSVPCNNEYFFICSLPDDVRNM